MPFTAIQDTPIFVDLVQQAKTTGWSVDGSIATHESCNQGNISLTGYNLTIGATYTAVFEVIDITSGSLQLTLGSQPGTSITTPGFYSQQFTATGTDTHFFSNGNCSVELFSVQTQPTPISPFQQNTIAYSDKNSQDEEGTDKWGSWYTKVPDIGCSLFENIYEFNYGQLYITEHNNDNRCNFFGVQYPATIQFTTNEQPTVVKTFTSINYQCNELLVSPSLISTSLGQSSELSPVDFQQQVFNNGDIGYTAEGVYKASFLRDSNIDLINGDFLKGNWMKVGLQTASPSGVMELFSTEIMYARSYSNTR